MWKFYCVCMILINVGLRLIFSGFWVIYLCYIWVIELVYIKYNLKGYVIFGGYGIKVMYINGCQYKFELIVSFLGLIGFQFLVVEFDGENWDVVRMDVMFNWYVVVEGLQV